MLTKLCLNIYHRYSGFTLSIFAVINCLLVKTLNNTIPDVTLVGFLEVWWNAGNLSSACLFLQVVGI